MVGGKIRRRRILCDIRKQYEIPMSGSTNKIIFKHSLLPILHILCITAFAYWQRGVIETDLKAHKI